MNRSTKFNFYLPQITDPIDPSDYDYNFEIIDENLITELQSFTDTQKSTARTNIGAASAADLGSPSSASGVTGNDAFAKINTLNSNISDLKKFNYVDISDSTPVNITNKASEAGVSVNYGNFITAVAQDDEVICLPYYSSTYNKMYCALKNLSLNNVSGTKTIRVYYRT